jgi:hypothetical protein
MSKRTSSNYVNDANINITHLPFDIIQKILSHTDTATFINAVKTGNLFYHPAKYSLPTDCLAMGPLSYYEELAPGMKRLCKVFVDKSIDEHIEVYSLAINARCESFDFSKVKINNGLTIDGGNFLTDIPRISNLYIMNNKSIKKIRKITGNIIILHNLINLEEIDEIVDCHSVYIGHCKNLRTIGMVMNVSNIHMEYNGIGNMKDLTTVKYIDKTVI